MLVLFETPAGYALFKVLDEGLLKKPDNIWESFENPSKASKAYVISHSPEIPPSSEESTCCIDFGSSILVEQLHVVYDSCLTPAHFGYFRVKLQAFEKFEDTEELPEKMGFQERPERRYVWPIPLSQNMPAATLGFAACVVVEHWDSR
jgi:hypothetical protein